MAIFVILYIFPCSPICLETASILMIPILAKESEREEQNEKRNYVKMKILRALKTESFQD